MRTKYFLLFHLILFFQCAPKEIAELEKRNVLFIAVDDLRPELNCYGSTQIKSPNFIC